MNDNPIHPGGTAVPSKSRFTAAPVSLPDLPDRWIATGRGRRQVVGNAIRRHPVAGLWSALTRRRGHIPTAGPSPSTDDILERVAALPISTWSYGYDHPTVRHLGPMAQDFAAAFGLGHTDRRISTVDAVGVCLAAIQALHARVVTLEQQLRDRDKAYETR